MQVKRADVSTRLREEEEAALPVHFLAHSLNLCLQDARRENNVVVDWIEPDVDYCGPGL